MVNNLSGETSPYLQQHADNPVEWYPWCQEALDKAVDENKPILLSIGYSACHWCHVMAHESFENMDTAALMNQLFINIKVDREERPDLDRIYQLSHQLLTQRGGGWPLTMFLTPGNLLPFFGGTYFPPLPRYNMPAFPDLLQRVADYYQDHRDEIESQNGRLVEALANLEPAGMQSDVTLNAAPLDASRHQLEHIFDNKHGGFGRAPKFPHPPHIERLLRHWATSIIEQRADDKALSIACFTLKRMALGGIYDQVGGGFCRYSVDDQWTIPHFEKMLYDNGQLLALYADAFSATHSSLFKQIATETAEWVQREMQSPEGGYYSTIDADSGGKEGLFYIWTPDEIESIVTDSEFAVIQRYFGLDQDANFEGHWHLNIHTSIKQLALEHSECEENIERLISSARKKLFDERENRIHPERDEKILTSWNGLMIKGMAIAGRVLDRKDFIASAQRSLDFIQDRLWQDGRLLATYKDNKAHLAAYLDDYVYLIDAIIELLQIRWRTQDLLFAIELSEVVLEHFEDRDNGGFFFTANDHEELIHRPKPVGDDAIPSGNGIAARVLVRLGHILGDSRFIEASGRALSAAWTRLNDVPYAHNTLLHALEETLYPGQIIVIRGEGTELGEWSKRCHRHYAPRRLAFAIPAEVTGLPGALALRSPRGNVVAYVCSGTSCSEPVTSFDVLDTLLASTEAPFTDAP